MIRKIIKIDENKCNGCGLCVSACHEGAIGLAEGKAKLMRDDYCDGLGDCLPVCPTGAITFEEREAAEYDETAVKLNMMKKGRHRNEGGQREEKQKRQPDVLACGCPGTQSKLINREYETVHAQIISEEAEKIQKTCLNQWPVQIKLVPPNAPYFDNASLLVAADCTAFAYGNFHREYMKNRITIIGCPKLDEGDYSEKLTAILTENNIKSVTVARMEVPCCGGIENAVKRALKNCGKIIPWRIVTISTDGRILEEI